MRGAPQALPRRPRPRATRRRCRRRARPAARACSGVEIPKPAYSGTSRHGARARSTSRRARGKLRSRACGSRHRDEIQPAVRLLAPPARAARPSTSARRAARARSSGSLADGQVGDDHDRRARGVRIGREATPSRTPRAATRTSSGSAACRRGARASRRRHVQACLRPHPLGERALARRGGSPARRRAGPRTGSRARAMSAPPSTAACASAGVSGPHMR